MERNGSGPWPDPSSDRYIRAGSRAGRPRGGGGRRAAGRSGVRCRSGARCRAGGRRADRGGADPRGRAADQPSWQPRWAPDPAVDGLGAFETLEDDRANSHPAGQPHIFVEGDDYRFTMHKVDRDRSTDRQRNEVRGIRTDGARPDPARRARPGGSPSSMYIPSGLKGTTSFTHIMQMKVPGTGSRADPHDVAAPLRQCQKIQIEVDRATTSVGSDQSHAAAEQVDRHELEITIGDGRREGPLDPQGRHQDRHRRHQEGASTPGSTTGCGPKWGIYRSLGDTSGSLQDSYLLLPDMRAVRVERDTGLRRRSGHVRAPRTRRSPAARCGRKATSVTGQRVRRLRRTPPAATWSGCVNAALGAGTPRRLQRSATP